MSEQDKEWNGLMLRRQRVALAEKITGTLVAVLLGLLWFLPLFICHFNGGCR